MYKAYSCDECKKMYVCKLLSEYNNKCLELTDTNTDDYQARLHCKHYEGNNDNK